MNYVVSVKGVNITNLTQNNISLDLSVGFINNSNIIIDILEQTYSVYINNKFITTITGKNQITINQGDNTIPLSVSFNPQLALSQLGGLGGLLNILSNVPSTKLKVDIKLKLKIWHFIPVSIPITIDNTLGNLMAQKK